MNRTAILALALLISLPACTSAPLRRGIACERAPAPIGPYSQAVQVGELLFLSGQIGLDAADGALVAGGIREETRRALDNLGAILGEAGFSFDDVVSTTVYLADLAEVAAMNEIYAARFASSRVAPARATVGVAGLPRGARVEIAAVALRKR